MDFSAGFLPCVRIERNLRNLPVGVSSISVGFRLLFGPFFFFFKFLWAVLGDVISVLCVGDFISGAFAFPVAFCYF